MRVFLLFLIISQISQATPVLSKERVIFHTVAGDIVFEFFPKVAPKHVAHFLDLVRAKIYNGNHFYRIEPRFVLQVADHYRRKPPLGPAQMKLANQKLPAEFSDIKHRRGSLSMARYDDDINSATTSFSIMLGAAPHLDGKYTVFGRVIQGMAVVDELVAVPRDGSNQPKIRLWIQSAEVVNGIDELVKAGVQPRREIASEVRELQLVSSPLQNPPLLWMVCALAMIVLIGVIAFFMSNRLSPRRLVSLVLAQVFVAVVALFIVLAPNVADYRWLGAILFLGLLALFRLMSFFELAHPKGDGAQVPAAGNRTSNRRP